MKKILTLLLIVALSLTAMVGCEKIPGLDKLDIKLPWAEEPVETPDPTPVTPAEDADLRKAYDIVHGLYKDMLEATASDYSLVDSVKVGSKTYKVTWTVSDERITLEPGEDATTGAAIVTVKVPAKSTEDINYTLKFTVTNEKGESLSREYKHYVPMFAVNTHAEYLEAKQDTPLVIRGIVVAMNSKSNGNTRNHLFIADEKVVGGYYIYQMDVDPVEAGIKVGMTVQVSGPASPYSGMQEIKGGVPEIVDTTIKSVDVVDITSEFAAGADLAKYVGLIVTVKGVTIGNQELGGTSDYLRFSLNGKDSYVRSYKTDLPTSFTDLAAAKAAIEAEHADHYLWTADATGILILYSGNPYLIPVSEDCFNYTTAPSLTSEQKVDVTLENLTVPGKLTANTTIALPLAGANYPEVLLTWTVDSTDFNIDADGNLVIVVPEKSTTIKLTATATYDGVTKTREFSVVLSKEATPVAEILEIAASKGHNEYTADKYLVAGVITEVYNTTYGNMKITDAYGNVLTVYGTYDADGTNRYDAMATKPVVGDYVVLLGVVGQYNGTCQLKNAWIQSWTVPTSVADAIALGAAQEDNVWTADKILVTGEITEIYNTTYGNMKIKDAAGNILTIYGTYDSNGKARFDAMTSQPKVGDTVTIYGVPGRYGETKQIKNGWIMQVVAGSSAPAACEHTNTSTTTNNPTCTVAGSTVVTCDDCGATVSTTPIDATGHAWADATCVAPKTCGTCQATEGEALGHNFVDGTCANGCGTTEEHVCEFVTSEKVVDPTCTAAGYTVYTCTCGLTENRDHIDALGHDEVTTTNPATCTAAGSTVVSCDRCEEVFSTTAIDKLAHVDANGDFKCDTECGAVVEPAADSVLTIEQALALGALYAKDTYTTNKYYVTGTIKNVYQTTYGNMYITDASGKELCVYGTYDATGATRYDALSYKPVKGDEVTVYGVIGFYTAAQMKNGWLDEIVAHEHNYTSEVTAPTCLREGYTTHTCSICDDSYTDTEVAALGHLTEEGTCDRCGMTIGGSNNEPVQTTVTSTMSQMGWSNEQQVKSFDMDEVVTVSCAGGANTGKYYNTGTSWRIYATDTPAGTITIEVPDGYELVSIKITTATGTYAFLYIDGTTTDISNKTVSVSGQSVLINSVKNGSNGKHARITAIEVVYQTVVG